MSTIILAAFILVAVILVVYLRFFKKGAESGCHSCSEVGCPLAGQARLMKNKKA